MADDFGDINQKVQEKGSKRARIEDDEGSKRPWLKVFETLPAQMLNAYGEAKYAKITDSQMWKHLGQPLKSGAMYMTEFCSPEIERRVLP